MDFKLIFVIVIVAFSGFLIVKCGNDMKVEHVTNCKVIHLQQQQIISGQNNNLSTKIRYLVITNKETFVCESSLINNKFDNSDIFFRLKEGETYNFKVCGWGKSVLTDYRNIIQIE